jgi:hypothetical protein
MILSLGILGRHKCNYIVWGHGQKKKVKPALEGQLKRTMDGPFKIEDHIRGSPYLK